MDRQEKRNLTAKYGNFPLERRAVIYARYSTQNQTPESIARQLDDCRKFAKEKGLTVVKEYYDEAKSGTQTATRDSYNRMLEDSACHLFSKVIVFKFDRFSRCVRDFLNGDYELETNGVELLSISEPIPPGGIGKVVKIWHAINAEFFAESVADHTKAQSYRNASKGHYNGGKVPYGYDVAEVGDHKGYVINKDEAENIREVFRLYAEGKSYADLAEYLDQKNARTKKGDRFKEGSFNSIFNNPMYGGELIYAKETDNPVVKIMPELQIVPDEILEKVRQRMAENKALAGRRHGKRPYILSGYVKCGKCESTMQVNPNKSVKNGKDYSSYVCPNVKQKDKNGKKMCNCPGVRIEDLERYVTNRLILWLFGSASLKDVTDKLNVYILSQAKDSKRELDKMQKLLKKHKESLSRLKIQKADGKDGLNWDKEIKKAQKNIRGTEETICKLEQRRDSMTCEPKDVIKLIMLITSENVKKLDAPEIRNFMKAYLKKIIVENDLIRIRTNINEVIDEDELDTASD